MPPAVSAQWVNLNSGVTNSLNSVYFVNENTGYAAGINIVLKTSDSGITWAEQVHTGELFSIVFLNEQTGFIGSTEGISKSTDAGNTWSNIFNNSQIRKIRHEFGVMVAVGSNNTLLKSTDSGNTFNSISIQNQNNTYWFEVAILSPSTFYITGDEGKFFITYDAGASWIDRSTMMPNPFFAISFISSDTGWLTGCCGMYFKTTDAGINWTPEFYITKGYTIYNSKFLNHDTGYLVADAGVILRTYNSGASWDSLLSITHNDFKEIFFLNNDVAFVVGTFGTIIKTTNGGGTGFPINIKSISNTIPESFSIRQNYPNPFNPVTKIPFELNISSNIELNIYDSQGKILMSESFKNLSPGIYEYEFNAYNFPTGIYFLKLQQEENFLTIKMLLLK